MRTSLRQRLDVEQAVRRYMGTILGVDSSVANVQLRPVETEVPAEANGSRRNSEFLGPAIQQRCTHLRRYKEQIEWGRAFSLRTKPGDRRA